MQAAVWDGEWGFLLEFGVPGWVSHCSAGESEGVLNLDCSCLQPAAVASARAE